MDISTSEAFELHEILSYKANNLTKAKAYVNLVSDPELKDIINTNIRTLDKNVKQLKQLINERVF